MAAQILDRVLTCYRIGDPDGQYPIYDATGSTIAPGRWNDATAPMIYASGTYSTAMLEKLVHGSGQLPPNQHYIEITVPYGISYEMVTPDILPGWHDTTFSASRPFGAQWQTEKRSAVLIVPSVVARMQQNILINPEHPEFYRIEHGLHQPVWWDSRLF